MLAESPAPRARGRRLLGALVSLAAIAGCAWWAAHQEAPRFPNSLGGVALVAAALLVYATVTAARGWRWDLILRRGGIVHRTADAYGLTIVGYMGNTVLPARGGEILRVLLLSERTGALRRQVLGSIVPERLLDAAALALLFGTITIAGPGDRATGPLPAVLGLAGLLVVLAGLVIYLRLRVAGRLQRFADRVRPFTRASRQLLSARGAALLALSLGLWLLEAAVFFCVTASLDLSVSAAEAVFIVVLVSFFSMIPAAPGYVGTFDAAALFGLHAIGITGGDAFGCVLLYRFVIFGPITLAGLILVVTRYGGLRALRRTRSEAPDDQELLAQQPPGERRAEVASR
jgi:uncharacterized membrane protein YbhN (UPF0104 family)